MKKTMQSVSYRVNVAALSTTFFASMTLQAEENPFAFVDLKQGYYMAFFDEDHEDTFDEDQDEGEIEGEDKFDEGKCAEGYCADE